MPVLPVFAKINSLSLTNVVSYAINPSSADNLVLQINNTTNGTDDTLTSIEFYNAAAVLAADSPADISQVKLWYQAAGGTFNAGTAVFVGVLTKTAAKTWANTSLNHVVTNASAYYVTLDISSTPAHQAAAMFRLTKSMAVFSVGGTYPKSVDLVNTDQQIIVNPKKLYTFFTDKMPAKADAGQANIHAMQLSFFNSATFTAQVSSQRMQLVNYAAGVLLNASLSRIIISDGVTTFANYTAMGATNTVNIPMTTNIGVPASATKTVNVYIDLIGAINTYDIGLRLPQAGDTANTTGITVTAASGFAYPFVSSRAIITQANNTANASHTTLMPAYVTKGQANIKPFILRFSHPQSVTTYADCVIKGITITAMPNDAASANAMFSDMRVSDGITVFSGMPVFSTLTGSTWLPFSQNLTITANTYKEVTVLANIKTTITSANFYMSLSKSADVWAVSGSSGNTLAVVMASSLTSTSAVIQTPVSSLGMHHTSSMPAYAAKSQAWVKAADFILTHPDPAGTASIEIKGITLNVEDSLGLGIVPATVISKVTILDALNNTVLSYSSIPSSGTQLFLNFSTTQILAPLANKLLKVYIDIPASPSGTHVKLNLNAPSSVNAVDFNSKTAVSVAPDSGDSFAMRTTAAQIVDAAVDVKVKHTDIIPAAVNAGQANTGTMLLYFSNTAAGVVSVDGIKFRFTDNGGTTIAANSVVNNVRLDVLNNTALVYADTAVVTSSNTVDLTLASPIILNAASTNAVTVTARFTIANPALKDYFRVSVLTAASITAKDNNLGTPVAVNAVSDSFPMPSGITHIQTRATGVTVQHTPVAAGPVNKGDIGVQVMEFAFENPGNSVTSSVTLYGITLTAENGTGAVSANTVFSRISAYEKGNPVNVYGEIISPGVSQYLYLRFTNPVIITPSASPGNVTVVVSADISGAASQSQFRLNLSSASYVAAGDANQGLYVTVTAKAPDVFPDMRSNLISLQAGTKLKVLHTDTMPPTASNGQQGIMPMTLRFSNTTDKTASIKGLTLTVENNVGAGLVPSTRIAGVRVVDGTGTTNISTAAILSYGNKIYLTFTSDLYVVASSYAFASIYVDLANNTYTSNFRLNLAASADIDWLPNTMTMEADSGNSFPNMRTGVVSIQLKPLQGQVSHNDVIPTTVSTGQVDIFAEILNLYNPNVTGTADIMLTGITLTVEDDTNTVIDPTKALKRIMIKDGSTVYAYFTSMPTAASSFYMPFDSPIYIGVSQTVNARLYIDIVDTLQAGTFRINIKIGNDIKFCDANSGNTVPAVAMNGDSFPMTTSSVIIQDKITNCELTHASVIPASVNRGQQDINLLRLDFKNPGGAAAANMAITRIGLYVQDAANAGLIARNALSKITIKDGTGTVYAEITSVPDNSAFVSIGLTTPITVQPGAVKQIFVAGGINPIAPAAGFKIDLDKNTDIIARDANSYEMLNVLPLADSFPMRSDYAVIQDKTASIGLASGNLLAATVNKAQSNVPALFLLFSNLNPAGSSPAGVRGITITVENNSGTGIAPNEVLSSIKATDGGATTYGTAVSIPSAGTKVYIPFTIPVTLSAGASAGVTVYADIAAVTSRLYFMLDLNSQADIYAVEQNSGDVLGSVAASYPMRTAVSTILSTPGIKVQKANTLFTNVTAGQRGVPAMDLRLANIGSLSEQVMGVTVTVKDEFGADTNAQVLLSAIYFLDSSLNTRAAKAVSVSGTDVYLDLSSSPITILPQQSADAYIYYDVTAAALNTKFYLRLAPGSMTATAVVSADSGYSFPMDCQLISVERKTATIQVSNFDRMPPSVSTGQQEVETMSLLFENTNPAGYSAAVLTDISITVKDSSSNTVNASKAAARIKITDGIIDYYEGIVSGTSEFINISLSQPLTITAGTARRVTIIAEITGNTVNPAADFKISIANSGFTGRDYNSSGDPVVFAVKTGYAYPMESAAVLIQRKAVSLKISGVNTMPAYVSTDQSNVAAMNLILTDSGDTRTASVMLARLYLYIKDNSDALINPMDVIKGISITNSDGTAVFGETLSFSGNKITVNLTSPVVVSTAGSVTAVVRVDIASSWISSSFKVAVDSDADLYAVDANSFVPVPVDIASGFTFPVQSGITNIENKATGINMDSLVQLAPAGVTKGQKRVPLFAFRLQNPAAGGTANAVFYSLTLNAKDGSNNDISASSAVEKIYLIDGSANTLAVFTAGVGNLAQFVLAVPQSIASSGYLYVTVYADIPGTAAAAAFKLILQSASLVSVRDENSGLETGRSVSPSMPWESGVSAIYDAPATNLHAWHSSLMPTQVGRAQTKVMMMALSMYNPGTAGTSDVLLDGVTMTAYDNAGNTLAPDSVLSFIEITDLTGTYYYGGVTASSYASAGPLYVDALQQISAPASNTRTVYFRAKIAPAAVLSSFKLVINNASFINARNKPTGYVTVTAQNSDSFPMETGFATVITSTNIVKVGHENLMPVSAVKGQTGIAALKINIRNESSVDMQITGITITVKSRSAAALNSNAVLSGVRAVDAAGNTLYGIGAIAASDKVFFDLTASAIPFISGAFSDSGFRLELDISTAASEAFYLELANGADISTDQPASILAASGDYFGNMKSSSLSLQTASLEQSYHNFPNPFNPDTGTTKIEYYLPAQAEVTIKILTLDGRPVRNLLDKALKSAGLHYEDEWDGLNGTGGSVKSGVYLCVLEVKAAGETKKLIKKVGVLR